MFALETADNGDLRPLVALFAKLQRKRFINALGIASDLETKVRVDARIRAMKKRLAERRMRLEREWKKAISNAVRLHEVAKARLDEVRSMLEDALSGDGGFKFLVDQEPNEGRHSYWFQTQIVSTAKHLDYYANTKHYRSWLRLVMRDGSQAQMLISFHCIGFQFQGVLVCSATWFRRVPTDDGGHETEGASPLSDEVFQINYKEPLDELEPRFKAWLEVALERGLARWEIVAL